MGTKGGGLLLGAVLLAGACTRLGFGKADPAVGAQDGGHDAPAIAADLVAEGLPDDLASPADGPVADAVPPDVANFTSRIFLGVQGQAGSYVFRLGYAPSAAGAGVAERDGDPLVVPDVGSGLRSFSEAPDGRLLVGGGWTQQVPIVASDGKSIVGQLSFDSTGAAPEDTPQNTHGLCPRQGTGSLIVGEFGSGAGNAVSEYALTGDVASYQRSVFRTVLAGGTLARCQAEGGEIWLSEIDAQSDTQGDVVYHKLLASNVWAESGRFDSTLFDQLHGGSGTLIYAFVRHSSDAIYLFPLYRFGARFKELIRCPLNLDTTLCAAAGPLPPDLSASINGADAILAAQQLPGSEEVLFSSNRALYHYDLAGQQYTELYDLRAGFADLRTGAGAVDNIVQVRGMVLR